MHAAPKSNECWNEREMKTPRMLTTYKAPFLTSVSYIMQTNLTKVYLDRQNLMPFICLFARQLALSAAENCFQDNKQHTENINQCERFFFWSIKCQNIANIGAPSNAFKLHINRNQADERGKKRTHSLIVCHFSYGTSKHCSNKIMAFGITVIDVIIKHRTAFRLQRKSIVSSAAVTTSKTNPLVTVGIMVFPLNANVNVWRM